MSNFGVLGTKMLNFGVLEEENWDKNARFWDFLGTKMLDFGVLKGKMGQKCRILGF